MTDRGKQPPLTHLVGEFREISKNSLKLKFSPFNENRLYSFSITCDKSYKCGCFKHTRLMFGVVSVRNQGSAPWFPSSSSHRPKSGCQEDCLIWRWVFLGSHRWVAIGKRSLLTIWPWIRLNPRTVLRCLLHPVSPGGLCAIVGRQENLPVWSKTASPRTRPDKGVVAVVLSR